MIGNHRWGLAMLGLGMFAMGTASLAVLGMVNDIAQSFGIPIGAAAGLFAVYAIVVALGSPLLQKTPFGGLSLAAQAAIGLAFLAIGCLLGAVAPGYPELLASRAIAGIGSALYAPASVALLAVLVMPEYRGRAHARLQAGFTMASLAGVPAAAWLTGEIGWRWTFVAVALLPAIACAAITVTLRASLAQAPAIPTGTSILSLLRCRRIAVGLSATVLHMAARMAMLGIIAGLLVEHCGLDRAMLPVALFAFGLAAIIGHLVGGQLADQAGSRTTILLGYTAFGVNTAALLVWPTSLLVVLSGFSGALYPIAQVSELLRGLPPPRHGTVLSLNSTAQGLGMALGASAGGAGQVLLGYSGTIAISLAFLVASALAASTARSRGQPICRCFRSP